MESGWGAGGALALGRLKIGLILTSVAMLIEAQERKLGNSLVKTRVIVWLSGDSGGGKAVIARKTAFANLRFEKSSIKCIV